MCLSLLFFFPQGYPKLSWTKETGARAHVENPSQLPMTGHMAEHLVLYHRPDHISQLPMTGHMAELSHPAIALRPITFVVSVSVSYM